MIIFTQPSHSMGFFICITNLQCLKFCWSIWHFYWFLLYIFSVLNMILMLHQFTLTRFFMSSPWSINPCSSLWSKKHLKFSCLNDVYISHCGIYEHLWVVSGFNRKLQSCHKHFNKPFFSFFKPSTESLPFPGASTPQ